MGYVLSFFGLVSVYIPFLDCFIFCLKGHTLALFFFLLSGFVTVVVSEIDKLLRGSLVMPIYWLLTYSLLG
jgi:hypothetical protein